MIPLSARADSGTITSLGTLGGTFSNGFGVSGDGSVVVGYAENGSSDNVAFRWTAGGGMVGLGTLGGANSYAMGVSTDGNTAIGYSYNGSIYEAFRWTSGGGMVGLGTLGGLSSNAYGVSADGSVVVGVADNGVNDEAFRWTQGGGMVGLGTLGGGISAALSVSADGSVIVGASENGVNSAEAFRWTQGGGMVGLGTLGGAFSAAFGVSGDGNVVIGVYDNGGDEEAFRWTQADGMVGLGRLGGAHSSAAGVSGDGSVVVGIYDNGGDDEAFRWTQDGGMQDLRLLLDNADVDMTGITLGSARAISADGEYIVGTANFLGSSEAFLVRYIEGGGGAIGGMTTAAAQQESTQNLATDQSAYLVEGRSTANELLGMTRPMNANNYTYTGGMFGSAVGYAGAQYSKKDFTLLTGIGYGAQDYANIKQDNAVTLAGAIRYTFANMLGGDNSLRPYTELGGSLTPSADMTFRRPYANGAGTATGVGTSSTTSWGGYARTGLIWDATPKDQIVGYGELGRQYFDFDGYSESLSSSNPFPATIDDGRSSMNIARLGASYTRDLGTPSFNIPVSITFSGAIARSFNTRNDLHLSVGGIGAMNASDENTSWGEFGTRLSGKISEGLTMDLDLTGTTGGPTSDTDIHGGVGFAFAF